MTLEEVLVQETIERDYSTGQALEEVLSSAKAKECLTFGVYKVGESYASIHFTLTQAFCFDNYIYVVRVYDMPRHTEIVGDKCGENPRVGSWEDPTLEKLNLLCKEGRYQNEWKPEVALSER